MKDRDWFIPRNYDTRYQERLNARADSRKSFKVKYCNDCKAAHEKIWEDSKSVTRYYYDFVTIGLERSKCERCSKSS